jgi:hypothetical protein
MCICFHVKYQLFLSDFNETRIFRQIFEKYSNINSHENPSSESRVVSCGLGDGQTDRYKEVIVAFRNFTAEPSSSYSRFCESA